MSLDFRRTFQSPMNNSTSKQLFSFSKASRFEPSRRSECKTAFYETKRGAIDKRAASFGFGNKINFASTENVPSAGEYDKNSLFADNQIRKKGYSFGFDENRSLINNPQEAKRFPGPGSYISINEQHKTGVGNSFEKISYSIRRKYEDPLERHRNKLGPGEYPIQAPFSERGDYYSTKYQNSKCAKIGKDSRFETDKFQTPGPGYYGEEQKAVMNGTGTYFNSKFVTTKANAFGLAQRPGPAKKNEAPDPGHYFRFSEFALKRNQPPQGK